MSEQAATSLLSESLSPAISLPRVVKGLCVAYSSVDAQAITPDRIVAFEVGNRIGEGGMAVVYEAIQEYPRRTVALKMAKTGMVDPNTIRRFERETQILAKLQHPGVPQFFHAGVADIAGNRIPFLTMERVRGRSIDRYSRRSRLDIRARVELFLRVCEAVDFIHKAGVIHRDLTVRNILVDERGTPRILDFGLAAFAVPQVSDHLLTSVGQPFGTLRYLSPEQARGALHDVDHQSDVYALGVIFYKLLTGRHPHSLTGLGLPEAVRWIQEIDPALPSTCNSDCRGDLDAIVETAMRKDKTRRYAGVGELINDLRCYLSHRPIAARSNGHFYRVAKFFRRHRIAAAITLTVSSCLAFAASGFITASHHSVVAQEQQRRATWESARATLSQGLLALQNEDVDAARTFLHEAQTQLEATAQSTLPADAALWTADQRFARRIRQVAPSVKDITNLSISPDERFIAIGRRTGVVELRDLLTNNVIHTEPFTPTQILFSPSAHYVLFISPERCDLWNTEKWRLESSFQLGTTSAIKAALSDDALAIETEDGTIQVMPLDKAHSTGGYTISSPHILALAWASEKLLLIAPDGDMWKQGDQQNSLEHIGNIPLETNAEVRLSANARTLAVLGSPTVVYDLETQRRRGSIEGISPSSHGGFVGSQRIAMGERSKKRYEIYDLNGNLSLIIPPGPFVECAFSEHLCVAPNAQGELVLYGIADSPRATQVNWDAWNATAATLSADGVIAAIGGDDNAIHLFETFQGREIATVAVVGKPQHVKFDAATATLAVTTSNCRIQFFDIGSQTLIFETTTDRPVVRFSMSRSGNAAAYYQGPGFPIKMISEIGKGWEMKDLALSFYATNIDLSPDGRHLVVSSGIQGIELWDVGNVAGATAVFPDTSTYVAFQDENRVLAWNGNGEWSSWELRSGTRTKIQSSIPGGTMTVAPSQGRFASFLESHQVYLTDLQMAGNRAPLSHHLQTPRWISASADGRRVLIVSNTQRGVETLDLTPDRELPDPCTERSMAQWLVDVNCPPSPLSRMFHQNPASFKGVPTALALFEVGDASGATACLEQTSDISSGSRLLLAKFFSKSSITKGN